MLACIIMLIQHGLNSAGQGNPANQALKPRPSRPRLTIINPTAKRRQRAQQAGILVCDGGRFAPLDGL